MSTNAAEVAASSTEKADDLDPELGELVRCPGEPRELSVAVRAPRPAVDQHDAEIAGQVVGQRNLTAADGIEGERGEGVAVVQRLHRSSSYVGLVSPA